MLARAIVISTDPPPGRPQVRDQPAGRCSGDLHASSWRTPSASRNAVIPEHRMAVDCVHLEADEAQPRQHLSRCDRRITAIDQPDTGRGSCGGS